MDFERIPDYMKRYRSESAKLYSKDMVFHLWRPEDGMCLVKMPTS